MTPAETYDSCPVASTCENYVRQCLRAGEPTFGSAGRRRLSPWWKGPPRRANLTVERVVRKIVRQSHDTRDRVVRSDAEDGASVVSTASPETSSFEPERRPIVVVGGGIAGLYSALRLAELTDRPITVLEKCDRWGGRIETSHIDPFTVEWGPMRFELDVQPLLDGLLRKLGVPSGPFPGATAGTQDWPRYLLAEHELVNLPGSPFHKKPPDSLNLLRLGIYLMLGQEYEWKRVPSKKGGAPRVIVRPKGKASVLDFVTSREREDEFRKTARLALAEWDPLLYEIGFWNALQAVLSAQAVMQIRDRGTFYHLIPDNPNAVEWVIFWLRLFRPEAEALSTIPAGSDAIVTKLVGELETVHKEQVLLELSQEVTSVHHGPRATELLVDVEDRPSGRSYSILADHVILALPQRPLQALQANFPSRIIGDVESIVTVPLLKAIWVGPAPGWWQDLEPQPQEAAWTMPTREVHYSLRGDRAMMMIYTDHPATEYWKQYLTHPERHEQAELNPAGPHAEELKNMLVHCLVAHQRFVMREKLVKILARYPGPTHERVETWSVPLGAISDEADRASADQLAAWLAGYPWEDERRLVRETAAFGIRDWSKDPYGAACHAWKPGVKSWEAQERLKAFGLLGRSSMSNVHVCGEAFSGYQGFIEGALQSAEDAIKVVVSAYRR